MDTGVGADFCATAVNFVLGAITIGVEDDIAFSEMDDAGVGGLAKGDGAIGGAGDEGSCSGPCCMLAPEVTSATCCPIGIV